LAKSTSCEAHYYAVFSIIIITIKEGKEKYRVRRRVQETFVLVVAHVTADWSFPLPPEKQ
jgi:hypothetical protein